MDSNLVKYTSDIASSFKTLRFVAILSIIGGVFISLGGVYFAFNYVKSQNEKIYILDQGHSLLALQADNRYSLEQEVQDHVEMFHMLFFNLAPNRECIEANKESALKLADKTASKYWDDLNETNHFNRLISVGASQQIQVDSIRLDMSVYPYRAKTFAKLYFIRDSNISLQSLITSCSVYKTQRSPSNSHGLMIEQFVVNENQVLNTKRR